MKVVIVVFAVILVVSLCLPFFSSCSNGAVQDDASSAASSTSDAKTTSQIDEDNQAIVDSINEKHASDPTSLAALGALGNAYLDWGNSLQQASDASDNADHMTDVYNQGIAYYDQYLEQKPDSNSVRVNRALCQYYAGDEDGAISALESFTDENADFSPAWYSLGMFYELQGRNDDAHVAYSACMDADAKDSYNLSTSAQLRAAIMDAYSAAASASSSADADASSGSSRRDAARASSAASTAAADLPDAALELNAPRADA